MPGTGKVTGKMLGKCVDPPSPAKENRSAADNTDVDERVWTFSRGDERLSISREDSPDGVTLIVDGGGTPRSYVFRDLDRVDIFQQDMETLLLKTGWTFRGFAPDRRTGRDRRGWPRRANDRRRWWTDGVDDVVDGKDALEPDASRGRR